MDFRTDMAVERRDIYKKAKKLTIYVNGGDVRICTDGEITRAEKVTLEMVPGAVKFAVPQGAGK